MKRISCLHSLVKVSIALVMAFAAGMLTLHQQMEIITRIMICWDVFGLSLLVMSWATFLYTEPHVIRKIATTQDDSRFITYFILLLATVLSVVAILLLAKGSTVWALSRRTETAIYISGIILSWMLHHTVFAFHYAHLFYDYDTETGTGKEGGLVFPEEDEPDYIDFAYFSFVIGMTFQVSDVTITSRHIRRNVLVHSVISFGFNTVIVALSVNAIIYA